MFIDFRFFLAVRRVVRLFVPVGGEFGCNPQKHNGHVNLQIDGCTQDKQHVSGTASQEKKRRNASFPVIFALFYGSFLGTFAVHFLSFCMNI